MSSPILDSDVELLNIQLVNLTEELEAALKDKKEKKAAIKNFENGWKDEHGSPPSRKDKENKRDIYEAYKAIASKCQELNTEIQEIQEAIDNAKIEAEKEDKEEKEKDLQNQLDDLSNRLNDIEGLIDIKKKEKSKIKIEINDWVEAFREKHQLEPTKQDKEVVRPLYMKYKNIEEEINKVSEKRKSLRKQFNQLSATKDFDDEESVAYSVISDMTFATTTTTTAGDMLKSSSSNNQKNKKKNSSTPKRINSKRDSFENKSSKKVHSRSSSADSNDTKSELSSTLVNPLNFTDGINSQMEKTTNLMTKKNIPTINNLEIKTLDNPNTLEEQVNYLIKIGRQRKIWRHPFQHGKN